MGRCWEQSSKICHFPLKDKIHAPRGQCYRTLGQNRPSRDRAETPLGSHARCLLVCATNIICAIHHLNSFNVKTAHLGDSLKSMTVSVSTMLRLWLLEATNAAERRVLRPRSSQGQQKVIEAPSALPGSFSQFVQRCDPVYLGFYHM